MNSRRNIPSTDWLLRQLSAKGISPVEAKPVIKEIARRHRESPFEGDVDWVALCESQVLERRGGSIFSMINASGTLLHTGLGRARLHSSVAERLASIAANPINLELDTQTGGRGDRQLHVRKLLQELTGAEDVFVVNNCAAAVWLTLAGLAPEMTVLLSRGQMVEIGGSFRIPDVVKASGARLVEVGCTNKTHLADYESAIPKCPWAILQCHRSNFEMKGFVAEPTSEELAQLAKRKKGWFIDDLGSGCLVDPSQFGLPAERTMQQALRSGADLVLGSGDKLLGGPQAGIILGKSSLIRKLSKHPVARAVRIDKLSLIALESTLQLYRQGCSTDIPLWHCALRSVDELKRMGAEVIAGMPPSVTLVPARCEIGGGSMPGQNLPSLAVQIELDQPQAGLQFLLNFRPAVIGYVKKNKLMLDLRSVLPNEAPFLRMAIQRLLESRP